MIGSDVMTGWADASGKIQIQVSNINDLSFQINEQHHCVVQDRFATQLSLPAVDTNQDWKLLSGEVFEGHTIIEVERKLTTCDNQDLPITVSARDWL